MKKFFFLLVFFSLHILWGKDYDLIQKKENVIINWTQGIIFSEYTTIRRDQEVSEKETFEKAYHHLVLSLLDLYFESGYTIKNKLQKDPLFQSAFNTLKEYVRIEKKITYLNKTTFLISFEFLDFFNKKIPLKKEMEQFYNSYQLPIKREKHFRGIIIYVPKGQFQPSLRLNIFTSTGKLIYTIPASPFLYYNDDSFIYQDSHLETPYVIYTKRIMNYNDIIIDQKDAQFLIATRSFLLKKKNSIKIVLYAE